MKSLSKILFAVFAVMSVSVAAKANSQRIIFPDAGNLESCQMMAGPVIKAVNAKLNITQYQNSYATCLEHEFKKDEFGLVVNIPRQTKKYRLEIQVIDKPEFIGTKIRIEPRWLAEYKTTYFVRNNRIAQITRPLTGQTVEIPYSVRFKLNTLENCKKYTSDIRNTLPAIDGASCVEKDDGSYKLVKIKIIEDVLR